MLSRGVRQIVRTMVRYGSAGAPKHPPVAADTASVPRWEKIKFGALLAFYLFAGPLANFSGK